MKVKVEQLNGENDVKPAIKMESNADIQIKQDPDAGIDQKPVKAELDEAINNAVKIEKTDQSLDEKSDLKSDGGGDATGDDKTKTAGKGFVLQACLYLCYSSGIVWVLL